MSDELEAVQLDFKGMFWASSLAGWYTCRTQIGVVWGKRSLSPLVASCLKQAPFPCLSTLVPVPYLRYPAGFWLRDAGNYLYGPTTPVLLS